MSDDARLRAYWAHKQGLLGGLEGATAARVLEQTGWARSVAGIGPYLTLFTRAGLSRAAADAAVAALEIHELPAARGCTYVVPKRDFSLALRVGAGGAEASMAPARKLGVTDGEIDTLCKAVTKALAKGALDPDGLRDATGNASRSLGEEGKKKGVSTTLPLALARLQAEGRIRRIPKNGRLDQQRYDYALWSPGPLDGAPAGDAASADAALTRRFFEWAGPATLAELSWFTGLGVKAAAAAAAPLGLMTVDERSKRLLLPSEERAYRAFTTPKSPAFVLVSSLDPLVATRRDVASVVDARDLTRKIALEKKGSTVGALADLPSHAIFDRGRLIGFWEYDVDTSAIVYATFDGAVAAGDKALRAAVNQTETFVRDDLGDARSFSLDSPKSRAPRIAALREMGKN